MSVPSSMGVATALNLQPTGNGKAAITGDFVLLNKEVNPVMKALRQNRHCRHSSTQPHVDGGTALVLHALLGNDDAIKLAKGLRAALDQTNSAK